MLLAALSLALIAGQLGRQWQGRRRFSSHDGRGFNAVTQSPAWSGAVQCLQDFVVQGGVGGDEAFRGEAPRPACEVRGASPRLGDEGEGTVGA